MRQTPYSAVQCMAGSAAGLLSTVLFAFSPQHLPRTLTRKNLAVMDMDVPGVV